MLVAANAGAAPRAVEQAIGLNNKAVKLVERGDLVHAEEFFMEALRLGRSVEDVDAIATNLVGLAVVYMKAGPPEAARPVVDEMLTNQTIRFPGRYRAAALLMDARLNMSAGIFDGMDGLHEAVRDACRGAECTYEPAAARNMSAMALLKAGNHGAALEAARSARSDARSAGSQREEANALRIAADALMALGKQTEALASYLEALALDKQAGLAPKIVLDLSGAATASRALGREDEALAYQSRAETVRLNHEAGMDGQGR
jgi:tetratricopeptide (TPR) repeat protein